MKQIPKPVLIFLVVILVLFVLFVVLGATHGDDDSEGSFAAPGWTESIKGAFTNQRDVSADEVSTDCPTVLQTGNACFITVESSGTSVRNLRIDLVSGGPGSVLMSQPERITVDESLSSGETVTIDVFEDGGTATLRCGFSDDCDFEFPRP